MRAAAHPLKQDERDKADQADAEEDEKMRHDDGVII
jgi:hypothetical protein